MFREFAALEKALPSWLPPRRWFGGKSRTIRRASVRDAVPLGGDGYSVFLLIVEVLYRSGAPERYLLPISPFPSADPTAVILRRGRIVWSECVSDARFWSLLLSIIVKRPKIHGAQGSISGAKSGRWTAINPPPRPGGAEQSNSSAVFGDALFLKLYRKLSEGINPEVEILSALAAQRPALRVAPYRGGIDYRGRNGERAALAVLLRYYPGSVDAWQWALGEMSQFEKQSDQRISAETAQSIALLGKRTADLHLALASLRGNHFRPEPFSTGDMNSLRRSVLDGIKKSFLWEGHSCPDPSQPSPVGAASRRDPSQPSPVGAASRRDPSQPSPVGAASRRDPSQPSPVGAASCLSRWSRQKLGTIGAAIPAGGMKIRVHGDYHLGQVLRQRGDFVIIDFEGEPDRTPEERRQKQSPLKDVAGMLRSFHYAASAHYLLARGRLSPSEEKIADLWANAASDLFLSSYLKRLGKNCPLLPSDPALTMSLLQAFVLDKALYELAYELNHRPAWSSIPLRALSSLLRDNRFVM